MIELSKIRLVNWYGFSSMTVPIGTFTLIAGKNGNGKWAEYFSSLSKFTDAVESNGMEIWLVKMYNDVVDDVFYATFGIKCDELK